LLLIQQRSNERDQSNRHGVRRGGSGRTGKREHGWMTSISTSIALLDDEKRNEQLYCAGVRRLPSMKLDNVHGTRWSRQLWCGQADRQTVGRLTIAEWPDQPCTLHTGQAAGHDALCASLMIKVQPGAASQSVIYYNGACHLSGHQQQ